MFNVSQIRLVDLRVTFNVTYIIKYFLDQLSVIFRSIQKLIEDCLIGQSTEKYLINSAVLSGCNCCSVIIGVDKN